MDRSFAEAVFERIDRAVDIFLLCFRRVGKKPFGHIGILKLRHTNADKPYLHSPLKKFPKQPAAFTVDLLDKIGAALKRLGAGERLKILKPYFD